MFITSGGFGKEDGGFCAGAAQSCAVWTAAGSGISHAMSQLDRLKFGLRRGRTRDVTGTLIFPDTNGGTLLIAVVLERQLKSKGRKYS